MIALKDEMRKMKSGGGRGGRGHTGTVPIAFGIFFFFSLSPNEPLRCLSIAGATAVELAVWAHEGNEDK